MAPHYKSFLDPTDFIGAADFPQPKACVIARIVREALPSRDGDKEKTAAPMIYFSHAGKELPRKFKVPKSVLFGLSCELGTDTDGWIGKSITLFATKCMSFGTVEECIRVQFTAETEDRIRAWLKKRKASPSAYMIRSGAA